ncbi:MAG TPA: hypothetical protein VGC30_13185 [Dokdonella sp.]
MLRDRRPAAALARTTRRLVAVAALLAAGFAFGRAWHGGAVAPADGVYTLYLGKLDDRGVRNYVATFDGSDAGAERNRDRCGELRTLLQGRATPPLVFWCEAGRYRG